MKDSQLHYRVLGCFSDLHRIAQLGLWKDYGEFLATESGRFVRRSAATSLQCGSYALQTLIASLMSIMIIVGFERIYIA